MLLNVVYRFRSFSRFLKPSPKYLTHFTGVMFVVQTSPPCRQIIHRAIFIACSPTKPQGCTCTGNPVTITTTSELKIYIYIYTKSLAAGDQLTYTIMCISAGKLYCAIMFSFRVFFIFFVIPIRTKPIYKPIIQ